MPGSCWACSPLAGTSAPVSMSHGQPQVARDRPGGERTFARLPTRAVRRAYEQVAEQLREWILTGVLSADVRLPSEAELARQFGTSRNTIREALRILSSQELLVTKPGNHGGSTVVQPSPAGVAGYLQSAFSLWADAESVALGDLLDARELLEVAAASRAAALASAAAEEQLQAHVPRDFDGMSPDEVLAVDRRFHEAILRLSGNKFLYACTVPIHTVLSTRVERHLIRGTFWATVAEEHRQLLLAIVKGDSTLAADLMGHHLGTVRRAYESVMKKEDR